MSKVAKINFLEPFLTGLDLRKDEVRALQLSAEQNPTDVEIKLRLLGYYHSHQLCCASMQDLYFTQLLWFIEFWPFSDILTFPICDATFLPEDLFRAAELAWEARLQNCPRNHFILANFAAFVAIREPSKSDRLYNLALSIKPNHRGLRTQYETYRDMNKVREKSSSFHGSTSQLKTRQGTLCNGDSRGTL